MKAEQLTSSYEDALPLDMVVDRYELVSERGRGGMGVVYKARDIKLDRFVALKFLPPEGSQDESARNRFRREARAGSATYHRNVCTVHDIDSTDDGQLFIVMADYDGAGATDRRDAFLSAALTHLGS